MKNILTYLLILIPFFAFSQKDRLSFSIETTGGIANILILNQGNFPASTNSGIASLYKSSFAYDAGALVNLPLSKKLRLQTGVKLVALATGQEGQELRWGTSHDGSGGWSGPQIDIDFPTSTEFVYTNYYLEFPVRLNIQLSKKSDAFQLSLGQSPTMKLLTTSKVIFTYPDRKEKDTSIIEANPQARSFNMHTQVGFIWNKKIKKGNTFYLFPNVRMQMFNQARQPALSQRYLFYGLSAGISI